MTKVRPGGATEDLVWDPPEGFALETVLPDGHGGLYLIGPDRTLRLAAGARKPAAFCALGSASGAACLGPDGSLVLGDGARVHRVDAKGRASRLAAGFGEVFGVLLDGEGRLVVSDWARGEVVRVEGKTRRVLAKGLAYPSGLALDARGRIYVKESGRMTNRDMTVRRIDVDGIRLFATVPSVSRWRRPAPQEPPAKAAPGR